MTATHEVLLPHTLRAGAKSGLRDELERRSSSLTVRSATTPAETESALETADILATMSLEDDWYDRLDGVDLVQSLTAGVDHIDLDRLEADGIMLANASGVHSEPISQQVLGYMLAFERNLHRAMRQQSRGIWERFRGGELGGKTLGIVGVGAIGQAVARVSAPFDMTVIGTKRDTDVSIPHVDELYSPDELEAVLSRADYLVLACPLTDETSGLIDQAALALMPSQSVLINIARGPIVDEDALITALQQRRIRGAALDVFETEPLPGESPLWDLSNVIITPHMSGSTPRYWERCAELIAANHEAMEAGDLSAMTNRIV